MFVAILIPPNICTPFSKVILRYCLISCVQVIIPPISHFVFLIEWLIIFCRLLHMSLIHLFLKIQIALPSFDFMSLYFLFPKQMFNYSCYLFSKLVHVAWFCFHITLENWPTTLVKKRRKEKKKWKDPKNSHQVSV